MNFCIVFKCHQWAVRTSGKELNFQERSNMCFHFNISNYEHVLNLPLCISCLSQPLQGGDFSKLISSDWNIGGTCTVESILTPLHKAALNVPSPSMLLALYHHCCPVVRVWLSIRSLLHSASDLEKEKAEENEARVWRDLKFTQAVVEVCLGGRNKQAEGVT